MSDTETFRTQCGKEAPGHRRVGEEAACGERSACCGHDGPAAALPKAHFRCAGLSVGVRFSPHAHTIHSLDDPARLHGCC